MPSNAKFFFNKYFANTRVHCYSHNSFEKYSQFKNVFFLSKINSKIRENIHERTSENQW